MALSNLNTAKILREYIQDDEGQLNIIAFHLQQSLELAIKQILEENGVEYFKTQDISDLIVTAKKEGVDLKLPEYLEDHADTFTLWEAKSRYILHYRVEAEKIDRAMEELIKYFKILKDM